MSDVNSMGSKVQDGFVCKPIIADKDKPIMFSSMQIFICEGERCKTDNGEIFACHLREIVKNLNLNYGENRVKVTRTLCNGSCRYAKYAYIYVNSKAKYYNEDIAFIALKNADKFSDHDWQELITSLQKGLIPDKLKDYIVESKVYDEFDPSFKH